MFERFTQQARAVVVGAQEQSRRLGHDHIGTEHLLLGLLVPAAGPTAALLRDAGVDEQALRGAVRRPAPRPPLTAEDADALAAIGIDVERILHRLGQPVDGDDSSPRGRRRGLWRRTAREHRPFTRRAKKVLELSLREAIQLKHRQIGTEHLLLGLLREGQGLGVTVLAQQGVDLVALRDATVRSLDRAA